VVAMRDLFQVVYDLKKKDNDKSSKHTYGNDSRTVIFLKQYIKYFISFIAFAFRMV
jgi:hypothetical protein